MKHFKFILLAAFVTLGVTAVNAQNYSVDNSSDRDWEIDIFIADLAVLPPPTGCTGTFADRVDVSTLRYWTTVTFLRGPLGFCTDPCQNPFCYSSPPFGSVPMPPGTVIARVRITDVSTGGVSCTTPIPPIWLEIPELTGVSGCTPRIVNHSACATCPNSGLYLFQLDHNTSSCDKCAVYPGFTTTSHVQIVRY